MSLKQSSVLLTEIDGRGNIEAIMDYILAWTFKMCDKSYHGDSINPVLLKECRKVLSSLIGVDVTNKECSIQTYFEWSKIDLIVEAHIEGLGYHAILIENKVKAGLPEHELQTNKKVFKNYYDKEDECQQHYWLICAYSPIPDYMKEQCLKDGYQYISLDEMSEYDAADIGNAIFDEFWRRSW